MARNILKTTLKKVSALTPTLYELDIEMQEPSQLNFKAGQFLMLNIPPKEGQKRPTLRAYSIASDANYKSGFKFIIKMIQNGVGSEYLRAKIPGDRLEFTGPFGKLLFLEPPSKQVLLISTGAGLSQHLSYLLTHGPKYPDVRFRLLLGVWNEQEIFYETELAALKKKVADFEYEYVIDTPSSSWKGLKGFVTEHVARFDYRTTPTTFYLCGNPAMINSVTERLKSDGVTEQQILAEAFS